MAHLPQSLDALSIHSRILLALKRADEVLALIHRAKANADLSTLPYLLSIEGDALLQQGDFALAKTVFHQAHRQNSLLPGPLLGLARCLIADKKYPQAISYLEKAVFLKPQFREAQILLTSLRQERSAAPLAQGTTIR
jgi:tetratricopeptide (TPR) repeat protein